MAFSWKWLISFTDEQKWHQWSRGNFASCCLCLSGCIVSVCVVCSTGGCCRCVSWWLLCLSCMSHSIHLSFLDCPCHDEYFSSPGLMLTNILQLFMCVSVKRFMESLCKQRQEFYIYVYENQQNSYSNINYLSDRDKSCVGGVLSPCATQHLSEHKG